MGIGGAFLAGMGMGGVFLAKISGCWVLVEHFYPALVISGYWWSIFSQN